MAVNSLSCGSCEPVNNLPGGGSHNLEENITTVEVYLKGLQAQGESNIYCILHYILFQERKHLFCDSYLQIKLKKKFTDQFNIWLPQTKIDFETRQCMQFEFKDAGDGGCSPADCEDIKDLLCAKYTKSMTKIIILSETESQDP